MGTKTFLASLVKIGIMGRHPMLPICTNQPCIYLFIWGNSQLVLWSVKKHIANHLLSHGKITMELKMDSLPVLKEVGI